MIYVIKTLTAMLSLSFVFLFSFQWSDCGFVEPGNLTFVPAHLFAVVFNLWYFQVVSLNFLHYHLSQIFSYPWVVVSF